MVIAVNPRFIHKRRLLTKLFTHVPFFHVGFDMPLNADIKQQLCFAHELHPAHLQTDLCGLSHGTSAFDPLFLSKFCFLLKTTAPDRGHTPPVAFHYVS